MSRGDSQERQGRSFGTPASLLPVAQGVNADPQRFGELVLRQSGKTAKRSNVSFRVYAAAQDPFTLSSRNRPREIVLGQFGIIVNHGHYPDIFRKSLDFVLRGFPRTDNADNVVRAFGVDDD